MAICRREERYAQRRQAQRSFAWRRYRFRYTWNWLAGQGLCDARGGMEYHRVYEEWMGMGCPPNLESFIRSNANIVTYSD